MRIDTDQLEIKNIREIAILMKTGETLHVYSLAEMQTRFPDPAVAETLIERVDMTMGSIH